ncbi:MAG TPA: VanZ family protein [Candidatus Aminicenantes bacterium]|nr:VanZ family protein [Candidatus Aminicenantes bacterium]
MHRRRLRALAATLLVYAAIFALSSLPSSRLPSGIPDILPHAAEYALLAFFLVQVFAAPRRRAAQAFTLLLAGLLGLLDEAHQLLTPGRVFSLLDILYDVLGAMIGLAVFLIFSPKNPPEPSDSRDA